jgi:hypothetical protein
MASGCLQLTNREAVMRRTIFNGPLDLREVAIDEIVASCNGDMRGAMKALMLVNEQLEAELQQVYAAAEHGSPSFDPSKKLLH